MRKHRTLTRNAVALVLGLLLAVCTARMLPAFAGTTSEIFISDYASLSEEAAAAEAFNVELAKESFTLLKNNGALPLSRTERRVSVFGTRSDNIVLGGGGSGGGTAAAPATVKASLERAGFVLNPTLVNLYAGFPNGGTPNYKTSEPPVSVLTPAVQASYKNYNGAAVVVISRTGSEFYEAALWNVPGHSDKTDQYYSLDDNEKALINHVAGKFGKVVVVVNSAHPIELGFVEDLPGVDSVLWMGHPGKSGALALGAILSGETNPSGRTVDMYPANFKNDPTWANFGANVQGGIVKQPDGSVKMADGSDVPAAPSGMGTGSWDFLKYSRMTDKNGGTVIAQGASAGARYIASLDYEEGIYVGYRWYETAAAEGYFDGKAAPAVANGDKYYNRENGVVYPFGHGLSYTSFEWTANLADQNIADKDGDVVLNVTVKNTGSVAGKDVVQVYSTPPYTKGGIEKAAANLIDFAKTRLLQPGESQTLAVRFPARNLASFDHADKNQNGFAGYELEAGDYAVSLRTSSHLIKNNGSAGAPISIKYTVAPQSPGGRITSAAGKGSNGFYYDTDAKTGAEIKALFTGDGSWDGTRADGDYYDTRHTSLVSPSPWTELTRADFKGTFPQSPTADNLKLTDDALLILQSQVFYSAFNDLTTDPWYKSSVPSTWTQAADAHAAGEKAKISLTDMSGVPFDDARWVEFMNQLTYDEMRGLISSNSFKTPALDYVGKPASNDRDGPAQISGGTFWVCEVNIAATWNVELAQKQGRFVGNESLLNGVQGWYGPGLNLHRNPAAGRNFEYYSQDGVQGGKMAAAVIKGARSLGVVTYMKHLFLNDQETSRYTSATFVSEQAIREVYGKVWELAIKEGGANASMSAFNKVGLLSTTSNYNLYIGLLEKEWGMTASGVTDMFNWGGCPTSSGDMGARTNLTPLGSWNPTFGRNIEGTWDASKNGGKGNVVVEFAGYVTNGTYWLKDAADGSASVAMNANEPADAVSAGRREYNAINGGASAAYKNAANMKGNSAADLYKTGDTMESYTQWHAVRNAAQHLLYVHANANTMKNGVVSNPLAPNAGLQAVAGVNAGLSVAANGVADHSAVYRLAGGRLPAGMSLNAATGAVTGAAAETGTFDFTVGVALDGWVGAGASTSNNSYTAAYTLTVVPVVAPASDISVLKKGAPVVSGFALNAAVAVPGNAQNQAWRVEGALPAGLALDTETGAVTGAPTAVGTYAFTVGYSFSTPASGRFGSGRPTYYDYTASYAVTVAADVYTVTFAGNYEGAASVTAAVEAGGAPAAYVPVRAGYIFTGWYDDAACAVPADLSAAVAADKTLYAGWKAAGSIDGLQGQVDGLKDEIAALKGSKSGGCGKSAAALAASAGILGLAFAAVAVRRKG
ncbi:MAG: glycoside hydrolase family 3 C-terminal domain-containing protein [Clostridiales bacterium]|jgi:beta-glucosidase|nr:glycoside hydrolase family 3 C-terminal domain-containing protein [Clostridiales bacterium]